jgi:hypothetical protein
MPFNDYLNQKSNAQLKKNEKTTYNNYNMFNYKVH